MSNKHTIRAVSLRKNAGEHGPQKGERLIRCDRPSGSPLANPFWMQDESQRNAVCEKFDQKLDRDLAANGPMKKEIQRIARIAQNQPIALGCWCKPLQCHCDRITKEIQKCLQNLSLPDDPPNP